MYGVSITPNVTGYWPWSCYSDLETAVQIVSMSPPPVMGPIYLGMVDLLDDWHCSS